MTTTARAIATSGSNAKSASVITAGEIFPDGTVIELVSGSSGFNKPDLLLWDGTEATIASRVEHGGCTYEAPELAPSIYRATRLPATCTDYESIRALFTGIGDLFRRHVHFPERESKLLACFCISTWLADRLPAAPGLVFYGPDPGHGINVLRLLRCLCRRPLMLGEVSPGGFRALPMYLRFTLLINQPEMTQGMRRLFGASSYHGLYVPGNRGTVLDLFSPKAVFV